MKKLVNGRLVDLSLGEAAAVQKDWDDNATKLLTEKKRADVLEQRRGAVDKALQYIATKPDAPKEVSDFAEESAAAEAVGRIVGRPV